jgi:hypothetical protein
LVPLQRRQTRLGPAEHVQVSREDGKRMGWGDILRVLHAGRPGQWAVMVFPPEGCVMDLANCYHVWCLDEVPEELRLDR